MEEEEEEEEEELTVLNEEDICAYVRKDLKWLSNKAEISVPENWEWSKPQRAEKKRLFKFESLSVEIPEGRLYHPSCGRDKTAWNLFRNTVTGFDLSDPVKIANFSNMADIGKSHNISDNEIIENDSMGRILLPKELPDPDHSSPTSLVRRFFLDGVLTLINYITSISIFYHTLDTQGEGGSNQMWLGPSLFPLVLTRLFDGGLIITDDPIASQAALYKMDCFSDTVAWNPLINRNLDKSDESFQFAGRNFQKLGKIGEARGPILVWQVTTT